MSAVSEILPETGEEKIQKPLLGLAFLQHLSEASLLRQLGLLVGLAMSVALGFAVVLWSQQAQYRPLLGSLAGVDAEQVSETLNNAGIGFHLEPDSGALLVKTEDLPRARLALAKASIAPQDGSIGFELLDREQGLGSSQFMEQTNYRRGLEGELARTIATVAGVKHARVHLAIPKTAVFVRDARKPSASVLVELYPGRSLEAGQVLAIVNLVAASVPEMESAQVAVVDNKGRLLSDQQELSDLTLAGKQLDYRQKLEDLLRQRLDNLLAPVLGMGRFQAQVTADLDFSAEESTSETFNPAAAALRSEQKLSEQRSSSQPPQGVPGALSNQPPAEGRAPQQAGTAAPAANGPIAAGQPLLDAYGEQIKDAQGQPKLAPFPADTREQATRNFEIDRQIQHSKQPSGRLKRLSVALVVDHQMKANAEGELVPTPWSAQEIEQLTALVQGAVGFDASRGDTVQVMNAPFNAIAEEPLPAAPFYQQPWFWQLGKPALALVLLLVLIFGLLRPLLRGKPQSPSRELALAGDESELLEAELPEENPLALPAPQEKPLRLPGATEGFNAQLDAIRGLVADDPGRVAQVVKLWMNA